MFRPTVRPNRALRLSDDELDLLKYAALVEGFTSWSAWARHALVPRAREVCKRHDHSPHAEPLGTGEEGT